MSVEQIVHQLSLGKLISRYKRPLLQYPQISLGLALGIPFFLLGLLILAASFDPSIDKGASNAALSLLLPSIGVIGFSLVNVIIHRKDSQFLYEQGLIDIYKGKVHGLRYDSITDIYQKWVRMDHLGKNGSSIPVEVILVLVQLILALFISSSIPIVSVSIYRYRFQSQNAARITSDIQEIGEYVKKEVFRYLLPQICRTYILANRKRNGLLWYICVYKI